MKPFFTLKNILLLLIVLGGFVFFANPVQAASRFWVGGTGNWDASTTTHWASTSGGSGGQSVPGSGDDVTLDASSGGGTVTMTADVNVVSITMGAFAGTLNANGFNVTLQTFSSSGTGVRTITMGSGTWTLTGNNTTIWDLGTQTNLALNPGNAILANYSGSTGTRTILNGQISESSTPDFSITAGSDIVVFAGGPARNLDFTGFSGTFSNNTRTIFGNLIISSGMTVSAGSSPTFFSATSGTKTITTSGKTLDFPITFNGVGGTWQLADDLTVGSTRTTTLTNGTFNANGKNFTTGMFDSNNSNVRTITMGVGTWTLTGNAATIWNTSTATNLTFNKGSTILANYSGSAGTRTITGGTSAATSPDINISAGSDTVTFTGGISSVDFTGFTGTYSGGGTLYSNLIILANGMTVSGSNTLTLGKTSSTQTITSNAVTLDIPITQNTPSVTVQLVDNLTIGSTRTFTLTAGTFDANGKNFTTGVFNSANSNARTITMGAGTWTLTGNTGTIWQVSTATNLTLNRGIAIIANYSGSSGTRNFNHGNSGGTEANTPDFSVTAGSDVVSINTSAGVRNFDLTGFTGTWNQGNAGSTIYGNLTVSSGTTITASSGVITFSATSGTKTITTNGKTLDFPITFNGVGGTFQLQDNFTMGSTRTLTLTNGTLDANTKNVNTGLFSKSGGNLLMSTGTWSLTGTGTVWTGAATITPSTSTISITDTSSSTKTFAGGGLVYNNLSITGAGTGAIIFTGANTFNNFTIGAPKTVTFPTSTTTTITGTFTATGSSGNLITLNSSSAGTAATLSKSSGTVSVDYVSLQDSTATGGATWNAGSHSTNVSGNTGWNFNGVSGGTRTISNAGGNWSATTAWVEGIVPGASDNVVATGTSGNLTIDAAASARSIDLTGYTGTLTHTSGITLSIGDNTAGPSSNALIFPSSGWTYTLGSATTSAINFISTSTTAQNVNFGGKTAGNVTFNGVAGSWKLAAGMTLGSTATLTLTAGTLDANGFNVTTGLFSSSNSNARTLTMGSGTWTITGNGTTIWTTNTDTNLTLNRGSAIIVNYSGSTGTRSISPGTIESKAPDFSITAGTDSIQFAGTGPRNVDFTGFAGTLTNAGATIFYGNLTISTGMTLTAGTNIITFAATSGTKTITTNGKTLDFPITFNGVGGTWQFADAFTMGATRTLTLTNGTLDANNKNVSTGLFSMASTGTVKMGTGTWTLSGTGTVWTGAGTANVTVQPSTSTIAITDTSSSSKTFAGAGLIYNHLSITGAGTGAVIFTGANTFNNFTIGAPKTVTFPSSTTTTMNGTVSCTGSSGNVITINSSTSGTAATLSKAVGAVSCDFLSLKDSTVTGGATWFAGSNSTVVSNVTGWVFGGNGIRTIANGGGNWNSAATWVEGSVPGSSDNVVATATSGNLTITANAAARSIDLTGYTGTFTQNAATTLSIGDATPGNNNNALIFPSSGWTYTLADAATSATSFVSTSTTAQTINFGGKTVGNLTFNGTGGLWALSGNITAPLITFTAGTLQTNSTSIISSTSTANDLTIGMAITKVSGADSTLTIKSAKAIIVSAAISSTTNKLNLILDADSGSNSSGYILVAAAITTNGGSLTMGGGSGTISANSGYAVGNAGQAIGININNVNVNAGGGAIIINGKGFNTTTNSNHGVDVTGASGILQTTGTGTVTVYGIGQGTTNSTTDYGIQVDSGAVISSINGLLTLNGTGGGAGTGTSIGIHIITAGSSIKTTGSGNISLTGLGGNAAGSGSANYGIRIANANNVQTTGTGNITITGTAGNGSGSGANNQGVLLLGSVNACVNCNITITGTGGNSTGNSNYGIYNSAGTISTTGTGTITLSGTGAGRTNSGSDVGIQVDSGGVVSTQNGNLTVSSTTGGGAGTGTSNYGLYITGTSSTLKTTGTGNIIVSATGGNSGGSGGGNNGIYSDISDFVQATGTGTISLTGVAGGGGSSYPIQMNGSALATIGSGITLNGNVRLGSNFTVGSGTATGAITFSGAIDNYSGSVSLTTQTTGAVAFNGILGGSSALSNIILTGNATTSTVFTQANTFNGLTITGKNTITFPASATQTISGTLTCAGTAGNIITIQSSSSGTAATLSKSSGNVLCDYLSLKDSTATGGASFFAGNNSTNVSGNTGWTFASSKRYWVTGGNGNWSSTGNWSTSSGGASGAAVPTSSDDVFFDASSGSGTSTIDATASVKTLDMTGFTGTLTHASAVTLTIAGDKFKLVAGMTYTLGSATTSALSFTSTTGTSGAPTAITTAGKTLGNVTLNGAAGYFSLQDSMTLGATATFTLTAGTFDANGQNFTAGLFSSINSNARTITMGSGTWTLAGNNTTIFDTNNATNLTLNRGNPIILNYSGSVGTRTINGGYSSNGGTEFNCFDFSFTAGTDTIIIIANGGAATYHNIDFTGFSGTLTAINGVMYIYGNLTISSGMTLQASTNGANFLATSGTKTITTNGKTLDFPITFTTLTTTTATWQLQDNFTMGSTRTLTLTNGTLDANTKNVSTGLFSKSGGTLLMSTGTWSLTGTGTVWTGAATITPSTSTISITDTSSTSKTFAGGGLSYNNLSITGAGTGAVIFTGANTFNNFTIGAPKTVTFPSSTTTTITGTFTATGSSGNVITINSSSAGTAAILSKSGGTVSASFVSLQDSTATGGATWNADANSKNVSGNTGWNFNGVSGGTRTISNAGGNWSATTAWVEGIVPGASDNVVATATSGNLTIDAAASARSIDLTGYTGTLTHASGITLSIGDNTAGPSSNALIFPSSGWTYTLGSATTSAINFVSTSTTAQNVNFGGKTAGNVTFNGANGSWKLTGNFATGTGTTLTLTAGTLDANGFNVTTGLFASANSNVRTLTMGVGTWTVTGNNGTIWNTAPDTNLILNRGNSIVLNYSGSTGTRSISCGTTESKAPDFSITAGSDIISTSNSGIRNLDFTGFSGTLSASFQPLIYGNITFSSGLTIASGSTLTLSATSGTKTITTNGKTLDFPVTFNGVGGTFQFADNFTMGSTRTLTLTNGTLDANNKNVSTGLYTMASTGTVKMGTGTWTLSGTGTVWTGAGTANVTVQPSTSTIAITDTSSSSKTFAGAGLIYNHLSITGAGTGAVIFTGANTFNNFTIGAPKTVTFPASTTTTITGTFTATGSSGNVITINSSTAGTAATLSKVSGTVSASFVSLTDSTATGGATWNADANSTNVSNNTGWNFLAGNNTRTISDAGGNWSDTAAWVEGVVPTANDDVVATSTSGNLWINTAASARSINLTNYTGTLTHNAAITLSIGSGTAPATNNALIFPSSGWTYVLGDPATSAISFISTVATPQNVNFGGKTAGNVTFNGVAGSWKLAAGMTLGSTATLTLTAGTFDANGQNVTTGLFSSSNSNTRTITMGSGTWTLTGSNATIWNTATVTNLTLNRGNAIVANYSGSNGTRVITSSSSFIETNSPSFNITAGTDTVNFSATGNLFNLDFTGFAGNFTVSANIALWGSLTVSTGMQWVPNANTLTFGSTSGTARTITTNGKTLDFPITFNGVGGTWQLADNLTVGASRTVTLSNGTINANGNNFSMGLFSSSVATTRTITMGTGTWTLTGTGTVWNLATVTELTFNKGTSTLVVNDTTATAKTFAGGGLSYNTVTFSGDNITVSGSNSISTLNVNNSGLANGLKLTAATTQTVGTFTDNGTTNALAKLVSATPGSIATLSKASGTVSADYLSLQDSTASGGATWNAGSHSTNVSNNSGWIFNGSGGGTRTISATGGNWNDPNAWTEGVVPGPSDNVVATSGSGNLFINVAASARSINLTNYVGVLTHAAGITLSIGDAFAGPSNIALKFPSAMTYTLGSPSTSAISFISTSATVQTIDFGTKTAGNVTFSGVVGSWKLVAGMTLGSTATLTLTNGTFDANGFNVTAGLFSSTNSNTRTITMGTGTWTLSGTGTVWTTATSTGLTLNQNTSTVVVSDTSVTAKVFAGSNTFNNFTITAPTTITFTAGTTQTIGGTFSCTGSAGNIITINSSTPGTAATLSKASGTVSCDYLSLQDSTVTGGATWNAGSNSTNRGNNTGWTFGGSLTNTRTISNTGGNWSDTAAWVEGSVPTASDNVVATASSGPLVIDANAVARSVNLTGYTGTLTHVAAATLTIGDGIAGTSSNALIFPTGMTYTLGDPATSAISFVSTSTTAQNVNFGGKTAGNVTFNGTGGSWKLTGNFLAGTTATLTLTAGTLDANGFNVTTGIFNSNNSNTRTITMGAGTWTITGSAATIWDTHNTTGLTFNRGNNINANYSGSTGTRTFDTMGENTTPSFNITAGTDTVVIPSVYDLDFTGFNGTWPNSANGGVYGNLTVSSGMTVGAGSSAFFFSGTSGSARTITSNGKTFDFPITFNNTVTYQLGDNLTIGSSRTVILSLGTINANNKNFSMGLFSSSNSGTRAITMGSGTWSLTGTGTVWNTSTTTGLTFTSGTSTLAITDTSSSTKTFTSGSLTFNHFSITGGGTGAVIIQNTNTFNNFTIGSPKTVTLPASITTTITGTFTATGSSGNLVTINSSTSGTAATLSKASGTVSATWVSLQDNTATGGATWNTDANSKIVSNVTGWNFNSVASGARTISDAGGNWTDPSAWVEGAVPTATDNVVGTATSGNLFINAAAFARSINLTNYTGTLTHAAAITLYIGDATAGTSSNALIFPSSGWTYILQDPATSAISFVSTSATAQNINSGGKTLGNVTFNGVGGSWKLAAGITLGSTATLTLTNGSFNANGQNVTAGLFSSSNANVRSLNMGAGTWTLTGSNATIWTTSTDTNLIINLGSPIIANYSGSNGTRTISVGNTEVKAPSFNITAGTDAIAAVVVGSLDFTGFSGTLPNAARTIYGSVNFSSGMTLAPGSSITIFASTSATVRTITTNGQTLDFPLTFNGVGGTWQLADNAVVGSTRTVILTNGVLDANGKNFSMGLFQGGSGTTPILGSGTWTLTGTGNIWSTVGGVIPSTSTIVIADTSSSSKNFIGGFTYNNISITGGGSGVVQFTGNTTFNNFTINAPKTISFLATLTINGSFTATGSSGNLITINSPTPGTAGTFSKASGTVNADYLSLQDNAATGGATWNPGSHSTNVSGNSGWVFSHSTRTIANGGGNWSSASTWVEGVVPTESDDVVATVSSGSVVIDATAYARSVNLTNYTATLIHNAGITLNVGNGTAAPSNNQFIFPAGMTYTLQDPATSAINFISTYGITAQNINFGGKTAGNVTFNGVAGSWKLTGNLLLGNTATLTITQGTFDANGFNVTAGLFNSSNSNTRIITMGSGTWTLTGNNGTIFNETIVGGLTFNRGNPIICNYSGAVGTRTISTTLSSEALAIDFSVTGGTDLFFLTGEANSLNFTGFSGSWIATSGSKQIYGNLTLSPTMTVGTSSTILVFFATTAGTKTITTNGTVINFGIGFQGVGGSWQLQDNLTLGSLRSISFTNGTLDLNNKNVSVGSFSVTGSTTRTLLMGSGIISLTGPGTAWNATTTTELTLTPGTSTIKFTDNSNTAITFQGGGLTYNNVWFSRGTSTASNTIVGSNTFNDFKDDGTGAHSILFTAGTTQAVATFTVSGTSPNQITLNSTSTATFALNKTGGGTISRDWLNVNHSVATPSSTWTCGSNCTNNQATTTAGSGWTFNGSTGGTRTISDLGGNWNAPSTWVEGVVPGASDNVVATATSGNLIINVAAFARSIDLTGYTGVLTHAAAIILNIGDATPGTGNVALKFPSAMSYVLGNNSTSNILFVSTSSTVQTIDFGGKTTGAIVFSGIGGSWQLINSLTTNPSTGLEVDKGTFDANGQNVTVGLFTHVNGTAVVNMGSGTWKLSGTGTVWTTVPSGLTVNQNTSTVIVSDTSTTPKIFNGSNTFNNFTITAPSKVTFTSGTTQTITGTFTCTGSTGNIITINSSTAGTAGTLSKSSGTVSCDYLSLQDSAVTGGGDLEPRQ